jgi:hypothetical protein
VAKAKLRPAEILDLRVGMRVWWEDPAGETSRWVTFNGSQLTIEGEYRFDAVEMLAMEDMADDMVYLVDGGTECLLGELFVRAGLPRRERPADPFPGEKPRRTRPHNTREMYG